MTNSSKAILWVVAVFVTGGLFGGALAIVAGRIALEKPAPIEAEPETTPPATDRAPREEPRRPALQPPIENRAPRPAEELRRISRNLNLKDGQRLQLRRIFQETQKRYQAANRERALRQGQIRGDMLRSIRSILSADQRKRFDQYVHRYQQRLRANKPGRGQSDRRRD